MMEILAPLSPQSDEKNSYTRGGFKVYSRNVRKKKDSELEISLKEFFTGPLAHRAGMGLSERACIALHIEDETYFFQRRDDVNVLLKKEQQKPDVRFWLPKSTARHLLAISALPGTGLGTMGVAVFEHIFTTDEAKKIKFKIEGSFLGLWAKGYFSVLKSGGPEVASFLARVGFDSISKIQETLRKIRS